jgi:4-hydroxybenzoate polyprenyltransferase
MLINPAPVYQLYVSFLIAAIGYAVHLVHDYMRENKKQAPVSFLAYARARWAKLCTTFVLTFVMTFILWDASELNYTGAITLGYSSESLFRALLNRYGAQEVEDDEDR